MQSWRNQIKNFLRHAFIVTKLTIRKFSDEEGMHLAAGVAYYVLLSIFPMVLLFVSAISYFQESEEITNWLVYRLGEMTPELHNFLENIVESAVDNRLPAGILGLLGVILSSTLAIAAIMRSINRAWGLLGTGTRTFFKRKLWEFSLLAGLAFILLLFYAGASVMDVVRQIPFPGTDYELSADSGFLSFLISLIPFTTMTGILLIIYKYVPTTEVKWRDVWFPSLLGAIALRITNDLLSWYFSSWGYYTDVYGSITGVIVLLLWAYICANILIVGAALSSVLHTLHYQPHGSDEIAQTSSASNNMSA